MTTGESASCRRFGTILAALAACAGAFGAYPYAQYPLYVVDAPENGATNFLGQMSVSVYATAETETPSVQTFSALSPTTGTFVKRGTGWMMSDLKMGNFTGEIHIENGVWMIDRPGMIGTTDKATAGAVMISETGTLAFAPMPGTMENNALNVCNKLHLKGNGFNGLGAIRAMSGGPMARNTVVGGIVLEGDATIAIAKLDTGDKIGATPAYELNGHTLYISGGSYLVNAITMEAGNIVCTNGGKLQVQGDGWKLNGTAANALTIAKEAVFTTYNSHSYDVDWTLRLQDGAYLKPRDTNQTDEYKWQDTTVMSWNGPIVTEGRACVKSATEYGNVSFNAAGPVSGAGGFDVTLGWINFHNALNTFAGSVTVSAPNKTAQAGVAFYDAEAWPANNATTLAVTNGSVYLGAPERFRLPAVDVKTDVGYRTNRLFGAGSAAVLPSLRKTGTDAFTLDAVLCVTGRTELAEGTLRLAGGVRYSDAPGLYEGVHKSSPENWAADCNAYFWDVTKAVTNGITRYPVKAEEYRQCTSMPYQEGLWDTNMLARYEGYIWNRRPETVRFGFALAFCASARLYIDDQLVVATQESWVYLRTNTVALTTGPHKFDLRMQSSSYNDIGGRFDSRIRFYGEKEGQTAVSWMERGKGLVWKVGEATPLSTDYTVPANDCLFGEDDGGDGLVFTRDTTEHICQETVLSNLVCTAGTTLDLVHGVALEVPHLEGVTSVTNGDLKVLDSWTLRSGDVQSAENVLTVADKLVFAPGAKIRIPDLRRVRNGEYVLAVAANGIEGMPIFDAEGQTGAKPAFRIAKDAQNRDLLTCTVQRGMMLIFR